jgi:FkbH-like protein
MVGQKVTGKLLTIASKNNEEDVWATFAAQPDMPLTKESFVAWRINWEPKSEGLRDMAEELQLGLDSFIFVDDSPTECAEVEAATPEVLSIELPKDAGKIPDLLRHIWAFDHLTTTEEDLKRSAMYGHRLERRRLQKKVGTLAEFLAQLDLRIDIAPAQPEHLARVSQLTQRTNQFNLTTIRRSENELREFLADGGECLVAHVSDRFGDYGLVGVILYRAAGDTLDVDSMMLSCRALGRGVEHRMLAEAGRIAEERGLKTVALHYAKTPKNRPAKKFLDSVAPPQEVALDNRAVHPIPAAAAAAVTYNPESKPGEPLKAKPAAAADSVAAPDHSIDYVRIATELSSAARILEIVKFGGRAGVARAAAYEAPRTKLEQQLADLWAEMLNVPQVGINDNFFDLGGHSLLAVQLLSRVRDTFSVDLSLDVVFGSVFNVAELAKAIELYEIEQAGSDEYQALLDELEGLSDEEVRALLEEEEKAQSSDGPAS